MPGLLEHSAQALGVHEHRPADAFLRLRKVVGFCRGFEGFRVPYGGLGVDRVWGFGGERFDATQSPQSPRREGLVVESSMSELHSSTDGLQLGRTRCFTRVCVCVCVFVCVRVQSRTIQLPSKRLNPQTVNQQNPETKTLQLSTHNNPKSRNTLKRPKPQRPEGALCGLPPHRCPAFSELLCRCRTRTGPFRMEEGLRVWGLGFRGKVRFSIS